MNWLASKIKYKLYFLNSCYFKKIIHPHLFTIKQKTFSGFTANSKYIQIKHFLIINFGVLMNNISKLTLIGSIIFTSVIGCNSQNDELEKMKKENEILKVQMLEKEKTEEEAEKQKLSEEVEALKKELEEKEKVEAESNRLKNINFEIKVDMLKPDSRKWDMSGGPDIMGEIKVNDETVDVSGEENNFTTSATLQNVKIKSGDKIKIKLSDKDFSEHDKICDEEIIYKGEKKIKKKLGSA